MSISEGEDKDASQKATVLGDGASVNIKTGSDPSSKQFYWHLAIIGIEVIGLVILALAVLTRPAHGF